MSCHIRRDDEVEVMAGDHKGARGKVLKLMPKRGRVVIQGINMVYRHVRPSRKNPQGGRLQKEAAISISNVLPVDPKTGRGARVRFVVERDETGKILSKTRETVNGTRLNEVTREKAEA